MKKKYLTLFMSIVLMAANIEGTEVAVYGADFTSEESVEADDISLQEECEEEENSRNLNRENSLIIMLLRRIKQNYLMEQ